MSSLCNKPNFQILIKSWQVCPGVDVSHITSIDLVNMKQLNRMLFRCKSIFVYEMYLLNTYYILISVNFRLVVSIEVMLDLGWLSTLLVRFNFQELRPDIIDF